MSDNIIEILNLHIKNIEESDDILEKNKEFTKLMDTILFHKKFITSNYLLNAISNKLKQLCVNPPKYALQVGWKGANYYHYNIFGKHICSKNTEDLYKNYKWNIDITHSFVPVINQKITSINTIIELFNMFDTKLDNSEKINSIENFINSGSNYLFLVPPVLLNFDNNPWVTNSFTKKGILSLDISQSNMNNLNLSDILDSLNIKTNETLDLLSYHIYQKTGKKLEIIPINFGNGFIISKNDDSLLDGFIQSRDDIGQYKLNIDSSGYFDINIRLPRNIHRKNNYLYRLINIKALYQLQLLEPLIISTYSSCDIRSSGDNSKYVEGSYSIMSNINNKPNQEADLLEKPNTSDYDITDAYNLGYIRNISQFKIVYKKKKIDSIHLKIWDNLEYKYLKNLLKILILVATTECKLKSITNHSDNEVWINMMKECIVHGWNSEISRKYIEYISKNLCINLLDDHKYSFNILEEIIDKLYKRAMENPTNLYWKMVWDKPLIENKPIVENINKLSWDNAFINKKNSDKIFDSINKIFANKLEYTVDEIKKLFTTNWKEDIHEILEHMVSADILKKRLVGNQVKYSKI